ncbi:hypothetical protein HF086_017819 [Spodoptera exigua]|uniref:RRM domain-containing protein n=1 Tax=Spodoptera exigua TaxID=7107 RepID=A0A922M2X4_SPOEX|nr:hypothetical protein HF086_017819 [Spodoptera exigua]
MKNVLKLSERELGGASKSSWHDQYKHSAWIFIGGLPYDLTEGDILNRTIRVDHCEQYRAPNADMSKVDEVTASIRMEGCAPLIARKPETVVNTEIEEEKDSKEKVKEGRVKKKKEKKSKKKKEKKSKKRKKKKSRSSSSDSESSD